MAKTVKETIEKKQELDLNSEPEITLNEYLSRYSTQHKLDNVIRKWYQVVDPANSKKNRTKWDVTVKSFFGATKS